MSSTLKSDRVEITNTSTRALHNNGSVIGALNTAGSWTSYTNDSGQIWTGAYGWLHDYFFSSVANCAGYGVTPTVVSNCGSIAAYRDTLYDNGSQILLRRDQFNSDCNCNCNCGDCANA